jgi:lysophosphatidate acyltransferase
VQGYVPLSGYHFRKVANYALPVLPPISTKGLTAADVDHLTQFTRDLMLKELIALTAKARMQAYGEILGYNKTNGVAKATGVDMRVKA